MALDLTRIRGLCFDVDGTLRDTDDHYVDKVAKLLSPFWRMLSGQSSYSAARKLVMMTESPATFLFGVPDRLGIDHVIVRLIEGLRKLSDSDQDENHPLIDGVYEMLVCCRQYFPMSVVSNRNEKSTLSFLESCGLLPLFQCVVTGQTCKYGKPSPEPLLHAANQMGVPASNCLMIGDITVDIKTAKAVGCQSVGVLCGFGEVSELEGEGADLILGSTIGLVDVLMPGKLNS
jgi:phosphoglycolate phosphatase